jgi:transcriptional regulator with XRE-family HTH domain
MSDAVLSDLSINLRLLCSYGKSVSDVCRRLSINRQQFSRYLAGTARPSLATLRRICDFFGIDEHEILLDPAAFKECLDLRPAAAWGSGDPYRALADVLLRTDHKGEGNLRRVEGCYHGYYWHAQGDRPITRYFMRVHRRRQRWCSDSLERFADAETLYPRVMRYGGLVASMGNKLFTFHRTRRLGSWWTTVFQLPAYDPPVALAGLTMGVSPETARPVCMRVLLVPIASSMSIRNALAACGQLSLSDPSLPRMVPDAVRNDVAAGDIGFVSRI